MTNLTSSQTYQDAYATLQNNANRLQSGEHIDIDALMDIVNDSINAYKICKTRIDAVEKALTNAFENSNE